jgi:hypothetical protein
MMRGRRGRDCSLHEAVCVCVCVCVTQACMHEERGLLIQLGAATLLLREEALSLFVCVCVGPSRSSFDVMRLQAAYVSYVHGMHVIETRPCWILICAVLS